MRRQVVFLNSDTGEQAAMPVTPTEWSLSGGREIDTVQLAQPREINVLGTRKLWRADVEYTLPAAPTAYTAPGYGGFDDRRRIIDLLKAWSKGGIVVRYIVTCTRINLPVLIGDLDWGERGGRADLWVRMSLYEYQAPRTGQASRPSAGTGNHARPPEPPKPGDKGTRYTVRKGDSLWIICRRHYGDGTLGTAVARANRLKNPNFIRPGQVIRLPPRNQL